MVYLNKEKDVNHKKIVLPLLLSVLVAGQLYADRDMDRNDNRNDRSDKPDRNSRPDNRPDRNDRNDRPDRNDNRRDDNRRGEQEHRNNYDTHRAPEHRYVERNYHVDLPTHRRPGWGIAHVPLAAIILSVAGVNYYYHEGLFYHPREGQYIVVRPPIGGVVPMLPPGYSIIRSYNREYYFYENTYYEPIPNSSSYRVVEFSSSPESFSSQDYYPLGTIIYHLPNGSEARIINGRQYYYFGGQYFLPTVQNGAVAYVVVNPQ